MIVVGAGWSSSQAPARGRLAPQVKQMRSTGLTTAAQVGHVRFAISSSTDWSRAPLRP